MKHPKYWRDWPKNAYFNTRKTKLRAQFLWLISSIQINLMTKKKNRGFRSAVILANWSYKIMKKDKNRGKEVAADGE